MPRVQIVKACNTNAINTSNYDVLYRLVSTILAIIGHLVLELYDFK